MAFEKSSSKTQQDSVEKNAVVVAAGGAANSVALSRANARLVQIDLAFATASPFLVSSLTSSLGFRRTIWFLVTLQLALAALTMPLALRVSGGSPNATTAAAVVKGKGLKPSPTPKKTKARQRLNRSPHLILLATGFLYLTVVSPGSLFLAWLKNQDVGAFYVAAFASAGQIAGIAGSLVVPTVVERVGLGGASLGLLCFQCVAVMGVAVAAVCLGGTRLGILAMCVLTVCSGLGLWGVDLTLRQLVQTRTDDETRVAVFGMQEGWTQVVSLLLFAIVSSDTFSFPSLCVLSAGALVASLVCLGVDISVHRF